MLPAAVSLIGWRRQPVKQTQRIFKIEGRNPLDKFVVAGAQHALQRGSIAPDAFLHADFTVLQFVAEFLQLLGVDGPTARRRALATAREEQEELFA